MGKWAPLSIYMHKPYKGVILGCLINDTRVSGPDENSLYVRARDDNWDS